MNKERVLAVADAIERYSNSELGFEIPELGFDMNYEFRMRRGSEPNLYDVTGNRCNTVACIAGWAVALERGIDNITAQTPVISIATDILGLEDAQRDVLFMPGIINGENYYLASPAQAVKVLRHLAETGNVNWWIA